MKILLGITASIITAAALFFAWKDAHSARQIRASLASLSAQHTKLNSELETAQLRLTSASNDEAELRSALTAAETRRGKSASPSPNQAAAQNRPDASALMQANPELREAFKRSFRANLALRFRPMYDAAKLSREQIDKFESIMTEAEQDKMDLASAGAAQGLKNDDPEMTKMRQQEAEKLQTAQQEVLGDAGYQQLVQYQRTEPLLSMINMAAGLVAHTSTPVTMNQVEQLIGVMANSSSSYQNGGKADITTVDWNSALPKVQAILSPVQ